MAHERYRKSVFLNFPFICNYCLVTLPHLTLPRLYISLAIAGLFCAFASIIVIPEAVTAIVLASKSSLNYLKLYIYQYS